ncbi:MAG: hypothetical protein HY894_04575 [Deltaproteobacteria bacterium]|nr:hypothetical protein [Deltaproteobacteria bacterium]
MRKGLIFMAVVAFVLVGALYQAGEANAAPTFARQTGMACGTCHYQHFPSLNAFGRAFKSGGYTMIGGQSMVEGDMLSLPAVLNAALITKIRYQKRNGDGESGSAGALNKGQLQFPDEGALLIGGRAGEHIGFLLEGQITDNTAPFFASFKMPVVYGKDVQFSFIPFTTDSAGAPYGFELLNTGAVRMTRPVEHRTETSAQQYIGTDGAATGGAFVVSNGMFFANYSIWSPTHGANSTGPELNYLRLAATPTFAGWDFGAGIQSWSGTAKQPGAGATPTRTMAKAIAFDAQAQGTAGPVPLGVYFTWAKAAKSKSGKIANMYNASANRAKSAWTLVAEAGVIPNKLTALAAYRAGKNGDPTGIGKDKDNATTIGANYNVAQNVEVQLNHSWYTGNANKGNLRSDGNTLTTLMLFAAF